MAKIATTGKFELFKELIFASRINFPTKSQNILELIAVKNAG